MRPSASRFPHLLWNASAKSEPDFADFGRFAPRTWQLPLRDRKLNFRLTLNNLRPTNSENLVKIDLAHPEIIGLQAEGQKIKNKKHQQNNSPRLIMTKESRNKMTKSVEWLSDSDSVYSPHDMPARLKLNAKALLELCLNEDWPIALSWAK